MTDLVPDQGMQIAFGTDTGVYFTDLRDRSRGPVQVLALLDVMQVDVLEEYELLVVLSGRRSASQSLAQTGAHPFHAQNGPSSPFHWMLWTWPTRPPAFVEQRKCPPTRPSSKRGYA